MDLPSLWLRVLALVVVASRVALWTGTVTPSEPSVISCTGGLKATLAVSDMRRLYFTQIQSRRDTYTRTTLLLALLIMSGDIEQNPGPGTKYPCGMCNRTVARNHRAVCCDECDSWLHIKCCGIDPKTYTNLVNSNCSWICPTCTLPNFSDSLFDSESDITGVNQFDSLLNVSSESQPENSPVTRKSIPPRLKPLKLMIINCCSIQSKAKQSLFHSAIEEHKPDLILGTESHLSSDISTAEVFPSHYAVHRKDRNINGGGVFVAAKRDLIISDLVALDIDDLETSWNSIQLKGRKQLIIGSFYRPPKSRNETLAKLVETFDKIQNLYGNSTIVLGGDFNLPGVNWDTGQISPNPNYPVYLYHQFIDMCNDFNLTQVNTLPTRNNNILDLIITNTPDLIANVTTSPGISDHDLLTAELRARQVINKKAPRTVYMYGKGDMTKVCDEMEAFKETFLASSPSKRNVEENWCTFKAKLAEVMKAHIPQKTIRTRTSLPWISHEIKRKMKQRQRLYNRAKRSKDEHDVAAFKTCRKIVKRMLQQAHDNYLGEILNLPKQACQKKFWSYIKSQKKDNVGIPPLRDCTTDALVTDSKAKAEILSRQYQSVFTKENLVDIPQQTSEPVASMDKIWITDSGITKLLKSINTKKACGPDCVPSRILKETAIHIGPVLAFIFQQSLDTGELPSDWLTANISAIHKKGDRSMASNYRPVSLTSVTCKILEHVVFTNIMSHLDQFNVLSNIQHGFRAKHSCETQLTLTVNDLAQSLDSKKVTDMLILDFSKAFDTVPHKRLLGKLEHCGVDRDTHKWISSWLTHRTQRVVVDGDASDAVPVQSGVPQGTVLGPLMFLIYINDIGDSVNSKIRLFADDCVLYRQIDTQADHNKLQADLQKLNEWAEQWQMNFNASKCFVMSIGTVRNKKCFDYTLKGTMLGRVAHSPYLGVELTDDLMWNRHIGNITMKANKALGFVRRNLAQASPVVKELAYFSLVRPHLEYASVVWDPYHTTMVNKLEKVQNRAARFVKKDYDRTSSITAMKKELQWDTLADRRKQKRLTMFYKAVHSSVALPLPAYLVKNIRASRQDHNQKYREVQCRIDTFKESFFPRTVREWNKLSQDTVDSPSWSSFAEKLKASHITV